MERVGELRPVTCSIDSHAYVRILRNSLPRAQQAIFDEGHYVFQQDNAPFNVSKTSLLWFKCRKIELLEWP
jgi:hypothetical protein